MPEEEENAAARLGEDYIWRMVIGKKIVCSECGVHTPKWFEFSLTLVGPKAFGPKAFVRVKCTKCGHEGDYNPIHDHGTKTIMGISTTGWTKVPQQILDQPVAGSPEYSLYNTSSSSSIWFGIFTCENS